MSVDRTENKNDRKGLAQVGYCLKYLMNFLRPYKGGLVLGLLMVVVANITFCGDAGGGGRDDNTAL